MGIYRSVVGYRTTERCPEDRESGAGLKLRATHARAAGATTVCQVRRLESAAAAVAAGVAAAVVVAFAAVAAAALAQGPLADGEGEDRSSNQAGSRNGSDYSCACGVLCRGSELRLQTFEGKL